MKITEYSTKEYNIKTLIPKRVIFNPSRANYLVTSQKDKVDDEKLWQAYSAENITSIRQYLNYTLTQGSKTIDSVEDLRYFSPIENSTENEIWLYTSTSQEDVFSLKYGNPIDGTVKYEISFVLEKKNSDDGLKSIYRLTSDNIPEFWKNIIKPGMCLECTEVYDFFKYAALVASYPEIEDEFELEEISDGKYKDLDLKSKTYGYLFKLHELGIKLVNNGKTDIYSRNIGGRVSLLDIAANAKKEKMREKFEQALLSEDFDEQCKLKKLEEVIKFLGPEVTKMTGLDQIKSNQIYDLYNYAIKSISDEGLTDDQSKKLKIAIFFYNIGTTEIDSYYKKSEEQETNENMNQSVDMEKTILERLGYSEQEIAQIGFYIENYKLFNEISPDTMIERIIENRFDFKKMGYTEEEIAKIVYILAHGELSNFTSENESSSILVDMDEVRKKMDSGEYDSEYDPSLEDYQILLRLSQTNTITENEIIEAYQAAIEKTEYTVAQFLKDTRTGNVLVKGTERNTPVLKDGFVIHIEDDNIELGTCEAYPYGKDEDTPIEELKEYSVDPDYDGYYNGIPTKELDKVIRLHGGFDKKSVQKIIKEQNEMEFNRFIYCTKDQPTRPILVMTDGTTMLVQASEFHYSEPRKSGLEKYESFEVSYPSTILNQLTSYSEEIMRNEEFLQAIFKFVPKDVIIEILKEHGGIDLEKSLNPQEKLKGLKQEKANMQIKNEKAQQYIEQHENSFPATIEVNEQD